MRQGALWLYAASAWLGASLTGCGQSGPLTLREAPPADAPADAPAEQAPEEQDDGESESR